MRIIAGIAGGRRLETPKGMDTRPTLDRVKESLFSMLMPYLPEADVLDLFAGSGALGLECISRGARFAALCDMGAEPCRVIGKNIAALGFAQQTQVLHAPWERALHQLVQGGKCFHLVLLDPPYRMTETPEMCTALLEMGLLYSDAIIYIEHDSRHKPQLSPRFALWKERRFGDTEFGLYRLQEGEP